MSNKKIEISFSEHLFEKMDKLLLKEIPLNALDITSRVFHYYREKKLIDYTPEKTDKRTWVKLNCFEAFWLLLIKELRAFNFPDKHIIEFKNFMWSSFIDYSIAHSEYQNLKNKPEFELRNLSDEEQKEYNEFIKNPQKLNDTLMDEERVLVSHLGLLMYSVIFEKKTTNLVIYPTPNYNEKKDPPFQIDIEGGIFEQIAAKLEEDYQLEEASRLIVPLKIISGKLFESDIKDDVLINYNLITFKEKKLLDAIRSGDYKEIIIKRDKKDDLNFNVIQSGEITGEKAKEIRRILGAKDFKNITLKFRNDKHIYFENGK